MQRRPGRTYLKLRAKARAEGRTTDELLQLHALESIVDRLSTAAGKENLVLKGGVLLGAYDVRRPTRDVDLAARGPSSDPDLIRRWIADIVAVPRDDGWAHAVGAAEAIREFDAYGGVRVTVQSTLASARVTYHVDVNVGDAVWPVPKHVFVPRLLGGQIRVKGYSLSMILEEKLVTALQRVPANTRWRDFADVYLITGKHDLRSDEVHESVRRVALARKVTLQPLETVLTGFATLAQPRWAAWVRKQELQSQLPPDFATVLAAVEKVAAPLFGLRDRSRHWNPVARAWAE